MKKLKEKNNGKINFSVVLKILLLITAFVNVIISTKSIYQRTINIWDLSKYPEIAIREKSFSTTKLNFFKELINTSWTSIFIFLFSVIILAALIYLMAHDTRNNVKEEQENKRNDNDYTIIQPAVKEVPVKEEVKVTQKEQSIKNELPLHWDHGNSNSKIYQDILKRIEVVINLLKSQEKQPIVEAIKPTVIEPDKSLSMEIKKIQLQNKGISDKLVIFEKQIEEKDKEIFRLNKSIKSTIDENIETIKLLLDFYDKINSIDKYQLSELNRAQYKILQEDVLYRLSLKEVLPIAEIGKRFNGMYSTSRNNLKGEVLYIDKIHSQGFIKGDKIIRKAEVDTRL